MVSYRCDNCKKTCQEEELIPLKDMQLRLLPGEFVPDGECAVCGAAVFEIGGRADRLTATENRQKKLENQIAAAFPGVNFNLVLPQFAFNSMEASDVSHP